MLLIYTYKITPRFIYIMKQIFTRILGIEIIYSTKVEDFIKHNGPKITYSKNPLQNEFFIRSHELLFENGIRDFQIPISEWEGNPCFFPTNDISAIPFDVFAASFYLLSRYEEYLPYLKDHHGRFPPSESFAMQNKLLKYPLVDLWAFTLLKELKKRFPALKYKNRSFKYTSIVDVTTSHCFAHRGPIRGLAGLMLDLGTFKFRRVIQRISVSLKLKKDPFDNYFKLIDWHKKLRLKSMFFFQFAEYSTYDKNVSPENNSFKYLIKAVADYSEVALSASFSSYRDVNLLKEEKKRLSNVINKPVNFVRMRYNRLDIPKTYRDMVESEFTADYTMGYTHEIGFKAGTCTPFYFYDAAIDAQQPIKIYPFAVHDYSLTNVQSEEEALGLIEEVYKEVKRVNGHFITVFSNELLGGDHKFSWLELYHKAINKCHV